MVFSAFYGSIRRKMIGIVMLAVLPVFLLLIYSDFKNQNNYLESAERDVQIFLRGFSEVQRRITNSTETLLKTVSAMPEIQSGDKEGAARILATLINANPIYTNAIFLDPKGDVLAMGKGKRLGLNFADRKQFKDAVRTKEFSYGEFVVGKVSNKFIFPFSMPVLDKVGNVLGVIVIGVDLSHYGTLFEQANFPEGSVLGLCDHKGIRLFRYPMAPEFPIGKPINPQAYKATQADKEAGLIAVKVIDGVERIIAYEPVRLSPGSEPYIYMFMGLDKQMLMSGAYVDLAKGLVVILLSISLALGIAYFLGSRVISRKIEKLAVAALRIGRGEGAPDHGEDYSDGELGQLFQSFDTMAHLLQNREKDLNEAKASLEDSNRALRVNMTQMRTLLETMPELVWLKDANGVYVFCNRKFESFFGASEAEIVGRTDFDFVDEDLAKQFRKHDLAAMRAGEPRINEETVTFKSDGHIEDLETIKTPVLDDDGNVVGVLGVARDITERKRITKELKESEMRFKALHNASFGGIVLHDKGRILDCNQGLSDITGYSAEELIGMDGLNLIAKRSRDMTMNNIMTEYEKPYEAYGLRKNGEEYPLLLEARNVPYKGRTVRVVEFRDLTDQKKAEGQLRDSEKRHRVIFENSPLGMIRFSDDGHILDCNDFFVNLMGSSKEKLIGFHSSEKSSPLMRKALNKALSGEPGTFEDYYTSVTGNKKSYLHVEFNPVNAGQSPTEVIATLQDFSERKRAQDELRAAKDQAENYSKSKSEFLTNMSHEIRTPLNGILGMLQLMQTTGLTDEQAEYVLAADRSSKRLTRLLTDILDLSRVEAGKLIVQHEPFDLSDALEQVCDLYSLTSSQTGVELRCSCDPNLPKMVMGDSIRLQQVLTNLIGNAYKFTTEGYVGIDATVLSVDEPGRCRMLFSISDTGAGIPDDKLGTLFDSFTQVSQGYNRQFQGAGLGLAICKSLVSLMGGNIAIESEEGVGTTLYVAIPFELSTDVPDRDASHRETVSVECSGLTILLAEDERVNSIVTQRLLEKAGHTVQVVENGQLAVDAVRESAYDVVLMDIQMPVMDGVEASRLIRAGEAGEKQKDIPIIAVTAYAMVGDKDKFIAAGMTDYVVKPIKLELLQAVLNAVCCGNGKE